MTIPVHVTFRHLEPRPGIEARIREQVKGLQRRFGRLVDCDVSIEAPHRSDTATHHFRVRIELGLPQERLVVSHDAAVGDTPRALHDVVREAFDAAERRLQDHISHRRDAGQERSAVAPA